MKTGIIVDLASLLEMTNEAGLRCDVGDVLNFLKRKTYNADILHVYIAVPEGSHKQEYEKLTTTLMQTGHKVFTRSAKAFERDGALYHKTDVSVDIITAAYGLVGGGFDHIVFVTGDSEMVYGIETLQKRGVKISIGLILNGPEQRQLGMVADSITVLNKLNDLFKNKGFLHPMTNK